jgi:signal peptidase I
MGKITGVRAKEVFLKAVQEDGALPTKRDGCKDRLFGGETVERGDVVVFNNQWPHKAPTEEYRDEHNKRSDEWKNKVSKYGRRWVYVSWRNKTNKVNAMQEAVHVNSVEALFEKQYNEDASEPDEERQAKKAKKD